MPKLKGILSTQMVAFCDCIWSTYEVFSTSLTFFASAHFHGFFQYGEKLITVEIPGTNDGVQKTFIWTVLIFTLVVSIIWVDSSIQLLIGTRQVAQITLDEINRCRYWLHLSFVLMILFAFKTYSYTGYVSAFIFSCLALLYRGLAIFIIYEKVHEMEKELQGSAQPYRVHFSDDYLESSENQLCESDSL